VCSSDLYDVKKHFDFALTHGYPDWAVRQLQFILYNARDFGFGFFALDAERSAGVRMETSFMKPRGMNQFIHCGGSCGDAGGCNNMSPFDTRNYFQVTELPAKAVLKLWRKLPADVFARPDLTFIVEMN
jgi:hypothetical protein